MWNRKNGIRCSVFSIMIITFSLAFNFGDTETITMRSEGMVQIPTFSIEVVNDNFTIEGGYGADMESLDCILHYNFPPGYLSDDDCYVNLFCEPNLGNIRLSLFPGSIKIDDDENGEVNFTISLFKDHRTELISTSFDYYMEIGGEWQMTNSTTTGDINPNFVPIQITPYCLFDSFYPVTDEQISGKVGEWKIIPINIVNNGNSAMNVTIEATSDDEVDYKLEETRVVIPEGGEQVVNLSVRQSGGLGRKNIISLNLYGESGESSDFEAINVPYKSSTTAGSFLLVSWWVFVLILLFIGLIVGLIIWRKKSKKDS